jgi:preprotein translocase subunit SecD
MTLARKLVLGLALAALLLVAVVFGWRLYRQWRRPDLAKDGGTVLVYEIDESRWPGGEVPQDYQPEKLTAKLKRRLDPDDLYGVIVRPVTNTRVEITLPCRDGNHEEQVRQVKELIALSGALDFRIVANTEDDREAIDEARRYFDSLADNADEQKKLERAASTGAGPPGPVPPDHKAFHLDNNLGDYTYTWIELGPAERHRYGLANDQEDTPFWKAMDEARQTHKAVLHTSGGGGDRYGTHLFYSRAARHPDYLPEKDRDKKYEYFVLCRDPERDEDGRPKGLAGEHMLSAEPDKDQRGQPAVMVNFDNKGAALLADLTAKNKGRHMAVVLDDMIHSAPTIMEPITAGRAMITGNFTREDVDRIVTMLRSGALPATLKPTPVSEISFVPTK